MLSVGKEVVDKNWKKIFEKIDCYTQSFQWAGICEFIVLSFTTNGLKVDIDLSFMDLIRSCIWYVKVSGNNVVSVIIS